jgi:hypothetical protein
VVDDFIILNLKTSAKIAIWGETFEENVRHKFFPSTFLGFNLEIGRICVKVGRL